VIQLSGRISYGSVMVPAESSAIPGSSMGGWRVPDVSVFGGGFLSSSAVVKRQQNLSGALVSPQQLIQEEDS
jgi:hypothetical protein